MAQMKPAGPLYYSGSTVVAAIDALALMLTGNATTFPSGRTASEDQSRNSQTEKSFGRMPQNYAWDFYKTPPVSRPKIAIVAAIIAFGLLRRSLKNQSKGRRYGAA